MEVMTHKGRQGKGSDSQGVEATQGGMAEEGTGCVHAGRQGRGEDSLGYRHVEADAKSQRYKGGRLEPHRVEA